MRKLLSLAILTVLFSSCEKDYDIDKLKIEDGPTRLIVEGWITDVNEPQKVKLTESIPFKEEGVNPPITDAIVIVKGDNGLVDTLDYMTSDSTYTSNRFIGKAGVTYQLRVELVNGEVYESDQELLDQVSGLDQTKLVPRDSILGGEAFFSPDSIYLVVRTTEETGEDWYRWEFEVNGEFEKGAGNIFVESDEGIVEGVPSVPLRPMLFRGFTPSDTINVFLSRIPQSGFQFLTDLETQATSAGSIFSTPPAPVRGNIRNINDSYEYVLGYFGTKSVMSLTATAE